MIFHFPIFYFLCHHFSTQYFPAPWYPLSLIYPTPYLIPSMIFYWSTHYVFPACPSPLFWWFYTLAFLNDGIIWFRVSWYALFLENILDTSVCCFSSFWANSNTFCFYLLTNPSYSLQAFLPLPVFCMFFFIFLS